MSLNYFATQLEYGVIAILSLLIAYEFYKTKDGLLRKLLIAFFICKAWLNIGELVYTYLRNNGVIDHYSFPWRLVLSLPIAVAMVILYWYIKTKE